ncbi:MAG TPA: phage major capsid protein [Terriglobales bacterium]|nr:phage major capsid protein [Terriglobales bacterium]
MNLFQMKQERQEAIDASAELLARVNKEGGRKLQVAEEVFLEGWQKKVATLTTKIDEIEKVNTLSRKCNGRGFMDYAKAHPEECDGITGGGGVETWKDSKGNLVPVLTNKQSYARVAGAEPKGFGFGEFIKSLVMPSGNPEIQASLSESGGIASGDVTVPTFLMGELIDLMRAKTVCIRAGAVTVPLHTENTDIVRISADPLPAWRSESSAIAVADPTFERVRFTPQSLAVLVKISYELLQDTVNLNQAISECFAGAFAVELDRVGLFGTGVLPQPHGISGTTNVGSVDMGTNGAALTNYDPFVSAISALLTANAEMPTAAIMAPRTLTDIAKLKDTLGQPMRRPDLIANLPFLATTSVPVNQTHGTSNAASESVVGDFTQLMFGIRTVLHIQVLKEAFIPSNGQIAFFADLRADVQLRHPQSFCEVVGIL